MSGFLTRAALDLEPFGTSPVWPAAAAEAVTVLLPVLSENVRDHPVAEAIARTHPRSGPPSRTLRAVRVEGPMQLQAAYDGLSAVWAWALGLQHSSRPSELVSGAYQHLYELDAVAHSHPWPFGAFDAGDIMFNQQLVRRATLAIERTTSVWEHLSTLVRSLSVNASPAGVTLSLNLVGHSTDRASATNTTAVLAALAEPDWQWVEFHQLEARIGPFSASTALDSDDAISLTSFRLDVSHHLKTRQRRDTGLYIGEPRRDQLPEVRGSLTLPYYDSDTLIDWALAQTVLMAELRFTGAAIGATGYNYQLCFWLPALQLEAPEAGTQGPADREQSFNFRALVSETDPAGFPTFSLSGPLYVELVSADSVNALTGEDQAGEGGGGEEPGELGGVTDGLRLHFIADSLALADDAAVESWAEESGAVTLTPTAGQEPTYKTAILNGHDVVRFVPSDGLVGTNVLSDMVDETGFTVFAVVANISTATWGSIIATDSTSPRDFIFHLGSTGTKITLDAENNTTRRDGTTAINNAGPHVVTGRFNGSATEMSVFLDGSNDDSGSPTIPADVTMNGSNLWIGKAGHTTRYFNGDIGEIAFYDRALSEVERQQVESYLMVKYGLLADSPPGGIHQDLRFWFKADDLDGTYADDDPVDSWTDATVNAETVSNTGAARPTYKTGILNGHSVVRFGGSQVLVQSPSQLSDLNSITAWTIFVVINGLQTNSNAAIVSADHSSQREWAFYHKNGVLWCNTSDGSNFVTGTASILTDPKLLCGRFSPGNTELFIDGSDTDDVSSSTGAQSTADLYGIGFYIGDDGFRSAMTGDIAEIVFYERTLSDAERDAVEAALMTKYGIA